MVSNEKVPKKQSLTIEVADYDAQAAPALYSNFWRIARAGTEVQIEFVFLSINEIAQLIETAKNNPAALRGEKPKVTGKTVSRIVMPGATFVQIKDHINRIFKELEQALAKHEQGENDGRERANSA